MIAVDRLILDMPGMTQARAGRLAEAIGTMLAARQADMGSETPRMDVLLPPGEVSDRAILDALAAALETRLG